MVLRTKKTWFGVSLNAPDAQELGRFYQRLLGWEVFADEPGWMTLAPSKNAGYNLSFQTEQRFERPVWPSADGKQQMQVHLDLEVDDLDTAVAHAVEAGAELSDHQPQDDVRVMLDPAGHPFCLYTD
ncbi:VOC family protein [Kribbella albertanoniae]|uniref:VOC family protein n=1 Tax=Kribbella albertanoniae TaxID=1266829 RepID=A0A4R4QJG0_9ACTN|nr:VOC family protein [Kribbella albertanoniae]TDC35499.1 VOC family protein [Kribbella albertanoniae]